MQSGAAQLEVSCTKGMHASPGHPAKHPRGPAVQVVGLTCSLGSWWLLWDSSCAAGAVHGVEGGRPWTLPGAGSLYLRY